MYETRQIQFMAPDDSEHGVRSGLLPTLQVSHYRLAWRGVY